MKFTSVFRPQKEAFWWTQFSKGYIVAMKIKRFSNKEPREECLLFRNNIRKAKNTLNSVETYKKYLGLKRRLPELDVRVQDLFDSVHVICIYICPSLSSLQVFMARSQSHWERLCYIQWLPLKKTREYFRENCKPQHFKIYSLVMPKASYLWTRFNYSMFDTLGISDVKANVPAYFYYFFIKV